MPHMQTQPCPVCADPCIVKFTHKGKPYWQCEPCGVQVFVRRQAGIDGLNRGGPAARSARSSSPARDEFWGDE